VTIIVLGGFMLVSARNLASFPGPTQLSLLAVMKSLEGPRKRLQEIIFWLIIEILMV